MLIVHPEDAHRIRLEAGRYMVALAEIGSDEQAVRMEDTLTEGRPRRRNSNAAALLCLKPEFNRWAARQLPPGSFGRLEDAGKRYIYRACGVASRADLDRNRGAARRFHELELAFAREVRQ
jgi:hypothetical protein